MQMTETTTGGAAARGVIENGVPQITTVALPRTHGPWVGWKGVGGVLSCENRQHVCIKPIFGAKGSENTGVDGEGTGWERGRMDGGGVDNELVMCNGESGIESSYVALPIQAMLFLFSFFSFLILDPFGLPTTASPVTLGLGLSFGVSASGVADADATAAEGAPSSVLDRAVFSRLRRDWYWFLVGRDFCLRHPRGRTSHANGNAGRWHPCYVFPEWYVKPLHHQKAARINPLRRS